MLKQRKPLVTVDFDVLASDVTGRGFFDVSRPETVPEMQSAHHPATTS
jgi:hypothetical protein